MAIAATFDTSDDLDEFVLSTQPNATNATNTTDGGADSSPFQTQFAQEIAPEVRKSTGETVVVTGVAATVITLTTTGATGSAKTSKSSGRTKRVAIVVSKLSRGPTTSISPLYTTPPVKETNNSMLVIFIGVGGLGGIAAIAITVIIILIARKRCSRKKVHPSKYNPQSKVGSVASLKSAAHRMHMRPTSTKIQPFTVTRYTEEDIF